MLSIKYPIILASNSPRRQQLMQSMGLDFVVKSKNVAEDFPADMPVIEVPVYLAQKKAKAFDDELTNELIITADTIVAIDNHILNKPENASEAEKMLLMLSGKVHEVITGVCLHTQSETITFYDQTLVHFRELSLAEIRYYIDVYKPYDKAGSYGAQEWMGMVGIDRIEGTYFNVMGLPVHKLYTYLQKFTE